MDRHGTSAKSCYCVWVEEVPHPVQTHVTRAPRRWQDKIFHHVPHETSYNKMQEKLKTRQEERQSTTVAARGSINELCYQVVKLVELVAS